MQDITFDDLMKAKSADTPEAPAGIDGDSLKQYATLALSILQEFNKAKGTATMQSRPNQLQSPGNAEMQKPAIDVGQIKEALTTVQALKGDINISSLLELLEENKEIVGDMLKGL